MKTLALLNEQGRNVVIGSAKPSSLTSGLFTQWLERAPRPVFCPCLSALVGPDPQQKSIDFDHEIISNEKKLVILTMK
jgi:hypothetical protein